MNKDKSIYQAAEILNSALRDAGFKHVSFGTLSEVDLNKQNIYPLAHINLVSALPNRGFWTIAFNLDVLDIVDYNDENPATTTALFSSTTNELDIFNDLAYRVTKMNNFIFQNEPQIEQVVIPNMSAVYVKAQNDLCGYEIRNLAITVPPVC